MTDTVEAPNAALALGEPAGDGTRRELLLGGAALALGLAGCGQEEPARRAEGPRTVRHALGTARVPAEPRRVVTMDPFAALQVALEVGVPVVGSAAFPNDDPYPAYLEDAQVEGIEDIGYAEPNLEKIAALRPDLVIGAQDFVEPAYAQLSRIAPTVALEFTYDWKRTVRTVADVLGRPGAMDPAIAAFERRAAQFRRHNREVLARTTVTVIRVVSDALRIHTDQHFQGRVLAEAGVRRPARQRVSAEAVREDPGASIIEIGPERIGLLDADVILNMGTGGGFEGEQEDTLERFASTKLWQRLDAVRNGRVHQVDDDHWLNVASPEAAELILDDLQRLVVDPAARAASAP